MTNTPAQYQLWIDGASRGNPGRSGIGVVITSNDQVLHAGGYFIGVRTNNQAEYIALIAGLIIFKRLFPGTTKLEVKSDSQLLVRQMTGIYAVRAPQIIPLVRVARKLLEGINCKFSHVLREKNKMADALANSGIDELVMLPDYIRANVET